ncbi:PREDICTED: vacuolar protein sorting-associated protein 36 [Fragaria vesca subsp. vesca]|uniref:vacuolar protein sorting-associated protein 36 n=1 Tax=Fragaria vesca subsp. vesca TaxID=101020 RepID=UPI0002C35129|nr:PREDICTED: vacuolar protein sorting-associated protein 36 [Fragaria vesca subsp. vesca]XP_011468739.1 PREDICTED: vacuolar protein sorting-associated protein 36 [Fragaria vesca subsp. vesca]XP_011468740.1 PREDICTED: vacuolar protein sorting-associated protein 36 [Fragaria vesca subsp. vesca]XP_011468741.1 PREDICTED: vacuolar protein sorting-associated protein 36 [Fragaria vesca subsp. vesca]XP_011468742.1 PREDICTED: vacuolar protein sorting-associated protein 36 [Fragaria vesca subsp. vesca]
MAGNCLEAVELTSSGRPVLLPSEIECSLLSAVDLECEDLPNFPNFKSGILTLTTHRILWVSNSSSQGASSAIPLASISHIFTSKKSLKSIFASPRIRFQLSVSPDGRVAKSGSGSRSVVVTVVVRGKGADLDLFLTKFWDNWRGRAWETGNADVTSGSDSVSGSTSGLYTKEGTVRMVGVSGILRKEQEMWETTDKSLQDAFQDLNALMSKAKEMVMLAEKMRQKLLSSSTSQSSAAEDGELGSKQDMQDWLLSVGIVSPVTKESAGALYHQQLSRQLADFVRLPLERAGGMMNLIDIYCLFNRARGTELISPEDLLQACFLWEKFDVPVMLRKFDSGVMVIQNKTHSDEEIFARIKSLATKPDALRTGISASDAAITLGIAPGMAKEHLLTAESRGILCRDISPDGFRFYINLFPEIDPNNVYLVKDYGVYDTWSRVASASG